MVFLDNFKKGDEDYYCPFKLRQTIIRKGKCLLAAGCNEYILGNFYNESAISFGIKYQCQYANNNQNDFKYPKPFINYDSPYLKIKFKKYGISQNNFEKYRFFVEYLKSYPLNRRNINI